MTHAISHVCRTFQNILHDEIRERNSKFKDSWRWNDMFKIIILDFVKLGTSLRVPLLNSSPQNGVYFVSCSAADANGSNFWKAVILISWDNEQPTTTALTNTKIMIQITYMLMKGNQPNRTLIRWPALAAGPSLYAAAQVHKSELASISSTKILMGVGRTAKSCTESCFLSA
jgi:hypothetical protein